MAVYNIYPAVDANFNFPPEIKTMYKGQILSTESLDAFVAGGMWSYYSNNATAPNGTSGTLIVSPILNNNTTTITQLAIEYGAGTDILKRFRGSSGWSSWVVVNKDTLWKKGVIPNGSDIREYMYANGEGQYSSLISTSTATMTGLPQKIVDTPVGFTAISETLGNGSIITVTTYSVWGVERFVCSSAPSKADGWTAWQEVDWVEEEGKSSGATTNGASGFKTLPLILTAGRGGGEAKAPLSATVEYDVNISKSIYVPRYRFAIRDGNPRWGTSTAQAIQLTNISVGGVTKLSSLMTNADGSITYSPWMVGNFGNLKFSYSAPEKPRYIIGGGLLNGSRRTEMPFELWFEVEMPSNTPAIGVVGDSNSVGVNATIPVNDAWMAIYCRMMGYFPVLYGHSGEGMSQAQTADHYKWTRWDHLDRPDMVVHANGANDIPATEGGITLAQMQEWAMIEWSISDEKISKNKHSVVIKSRESGVNNTVRVQYNNWIKSRPGPIRDWQDIASPVTTNDTGGLPPQYMSSDGIHMTTAAQTAIATSGLKVMTIRNGLVFSESSGRTAVAWDYINQREQLVYGDSGIRDILSLLNSGNTATRLDISREGYEVTLNIQGLNLSVGGTVAIFTLPLGFRPVASAVRSGLVLGGTLAYVASPFGTVFRILNAPASTNLDGSITFRTSDAWPTSMPGSASGVIPNN